MNKGWLLVGVVSAAAMVGAAIWVTEEDADEDAFEPADDEDGPAGRERGERPRGRGKGSGGGGPAIARIEALEEQVAALEREVKMLRAASGLAAGAAAAGDDGEIVAEDPVFEGAVRDIIETDRKEERDAEMERRRERFAEMVEESATELATRVGLDADQRNGVAALWHAEAEQVMPLFMAGRSGERPFSEIRDEIDKVRSETDAAAKKLLGEDQHEAYDELRPRGRRGDRDRESDRDGGRDRDRGGREQ